MESLVIDDIPFFTLQGHQHLCRLVDVYDGDTITVVFSLFGTFSKFNIRLFDIDTPEIRTTEQEEKKKGFLARQKVIDLTCPGNELTVDSTRNQIQEYLKQNPVLVTIKCHGFCNFGRLLAEVFTFTEKISINEILVELGYAIKFKTKP